MGEKRNTQ